MCGERTDGDRRGLPIDPRVTSERGVPDPPQVLAAYAAGREGDRAQSDSLVYERQDYDNLAIIEPRMPQFITFIKIRLGTGRCPFFARSYIYHSESGTH